MIYGGVNAQPNVCINPPIGYEVGGDFDITIKKGGIFVVDNYLCLPEKLSDGEIGIIDKSTLNPASIRYIFGVDNSTVIPSSIPLNTNKVISGQSAGQYWIMQLGEDNGVKKINCKKIQVDVSERPLLELSNCNYQTLDLNITINNPVSYYSINWNDGLPIENVKYKNTEVKVPHFYKQPFPEFIEVTGVYENTTLNKTCNSQVIKIATPPSFYIKSVETQDFGSQLSAIFGVQNPQSVNLDIWASEDNGIIYSKKLSSSSGFFLVGGLPKKDLCFKAKYYHSGRCYTESPPVCIISPKADNSNYGQIDLEWNNTGNNTSFDLTRTGGTPRKVTNLTTTSYSDKILDCNGNYLYQITGKYKDINGNETEVISHYVRSNANFNTNLLPKQALVATILSDGRPQLDILDNTGNVKYIIYRAVDNQPFIKIDETPNGQFIDAGNANLRQYCYYVNYIDACNNISPNSPTVCTVLLENSGNVLNWNSPINSPQATITYEIVRLNQIQSLSVQVENSYSILLPQNQPTQFQVIATVIFSIGGKVYQAITTSNILTLDFVSNIYLPHAFSPNGDGINDTFGVKTDATLIKDFKIAIFNQWGNVIFESEDVNFTWHGDTNETPMSIGTYPLTLSYKDIYDVEHHHTGKIVLLR